MLTTTQLATLSAAIAAETDPAFVDLRTQGATGAMTEWLNGTPSTNVVWRTRVSWDEIMENGMDFTRVDNLTNGSKWRIWEWLFKNSSNSCNPSKVNHRNAIDASWVGTAADLAVRAAIYTHCKRFATKAEALYITGAGTDVAPALLVFEGRVTEYEVVRAINNDF